MQSLHLFYLFTVRPFKYPFYTQASINMQLVILIFYIYLSLVNFYFDLSPHINTSSSIKSIMLATIIFFCFILLIFVLLSGYEFYGKVVDLRNFARKYNDDKKSKEYEE